MSILTHHLAIKAAVQRIEAAMESETYARNRAVVPSDNDAIESAMIARRNAYHDLKEAVDALINGGM